jgi:hypothetical protein
VTVPARIVVCQAAGDPLTTISTVAVTVHTEDGRTHYLALRQQLLADLASGDAARADRELCARMVAS